MMRLLGWCAFLFVLACGGSEQSQRAALSSSQKSVVIGQYQTDSLAAVDAGGRAVVLELKADSSAALETRWAGTVVKRTGHFSVSGPDLQADFPAQDSAAPMQFRWRLISTRLVPVDWDRTQYGPAGLTLHLR